MADERKMIDELIADESDKMSRWELTFIESMSKQLDRKNPSELSVLQQAKVHEVWNKVFG